MMVPHCSVMDVAVVGTVVVGSMMAQVGADPLLGSLINFGALGIVLAWFMFRTEGKLERIERALNRLARAELISTLSRPDVDEPVKRQARRALQELGNGDYADSEEPS